MNYRQILTLAAVSIVLLSGFALGQRAVDGGPPVTTKRAGGDSTPRLPDGHPNLSGTWYTLSGHLIPNGTPFGEARADGSRIVTYAQVGATDRPANAPPAQPAAQRSTPVYKSEFVAKVKDLDANGNRTDPTFTCAPPGLPRIGVPHKIVHGTNELVIVYSDVSGNFWRVIPTDGRKHNEDFDSSYFGDSVGHWEGDTLIIDTNNLNEDTWLTSRGTFHTKALHVTEKIRRDGDNLIYDVTVDDPGVLEKPWVKETETLQRTDEALEEAPFCKDYDQPHVVNQDRNR